MHKVLTAWFFLTTSFLTSLVAQTPALHTTACAQAHAALPCLFLVVGQQQALATELAKLIEFDLGLTDQLAITLRASATPLTEKQEADLAVRGTSLLAMLEINNGVATVTLRDTASAAELGRCMQQVTERTLVVAAHRLADQMVKLLTGCQTTPFLGTLAFCQRRSSKHKEICIADLTCKQIKKVVTTPTLNVAPCWHTQAPILFYSQFTRSNSRLMSYSFADRHNRIICSYDGLNMQPSFSPDGSRAVLCLSGSGNSELYLFDQILCKRLGQRVFLQLTKNGANNASPCMLPHGDVVYCSDLGHSGRPQLYLYDCHTKHSRLLTNGVGYCASPAYCPANGLVVYTRCIKGTFQLCVLDLNHAVPVERQLTSTAGDKVDPTWSPCGNYVVCSFREKPKVSQIALVNVHSKKLRILTNSPEEKSFPAWTGMNVLLHA